MVDILTNQPPGAIKRIDTTPTSVFKNFSGDIETVYFRNASSALAGPKRVIGITLILKNGTIADEITLDEDSELVFGPVLGISVRNTVGDDGILQVVLGGSGIIGFAEFSV